jgi:hypothetical protein
MHPPCLLYITPVVAKTAFGLSWEFWDAATSVDVGERGMFELVGECEVILHALKCFLKKVQYPAVTMWIERAVTYTTESAH